MHTDLRIFIKIYVSYHAVDFTVMNGISCWSCEDEAIPAGSLFNSSFGISEISSCSDLCCTSLIRGAGEIIGFVAGSLYPKTDSFCLKQSSSIDVLLQILGFTCNLPSEQGNRDYKKIMKPVRFVLKWQVSASIYPWCALCMYTCWLIKAKIKYSVFF